MHPGNMSKCQDKHVTQATCAPENYEKLSLELESSGSSLFARFSCLIFFYNQSFSGCHTLVLEKFVTFF